MDEVFLPSLSLSEGNCSLAEEIWAILRVYTYHHRYRLYGSWKNETYAIHPLLMLKRVEVQKKTKGIMQRISKENVKPTSRKIGKLSHSSPTLVFDYVSFLVPDSLINSQDVIKRSNVSDTIPNSTLR